MTDQRPPQHTDLSAQVDAARDALHRQQLERAHAEHPRRRRDSRVPAALAALAFVASLAWQWPQLSGRLADPETELGAIIGAIEATRSVVQTHWDSAGAPPPSLEVLGLGDLPFAYRASDREFTIAALSPFGDSVGYQSPTRAPRTEGQ